MSVGKREIVPLGTVVSLRTGPFGSALHKSDYSCGGIPVINPSHISGGRITPEVAVSVTPDSAERLNEFRLQEGDVVLGRRGEMGRCAVVTLHEAGWLCGTGSLIVRPSGALVSRYLQRFLSSPTVVSRLNQASVGSTMVNLNQRILLDLNVPIPSLGEQERIADKLDTVLARVNVCRERLDRVPAILKCFRQSVLSAATSGNLTEDWREERRADDEWQLVSLSDVAHDFSYGTAAKSEKTGSVPVLRMGNIQGGRLDWTDLVFTSNEEEIEKYLLAPGDVVFNRTNSPELVGKSAVYRGERKAVYAGYLIKVRCSERLLPEFLNYCLGSPAGRDYCRRVKSDGVSQSNINAKKLAAFEFALPPIEEQAEIVRRVEALFAWADRLEARLAAARSQTERLTPALLAKAFRGELVSQDPADEPAAELLARIAGNKETAKPRARRSRSGAPGTER